MNWYCPTTRELLNTPLASETPEEAKRFFGDLLKGGGIRRVVSEVAHHHSPSLRGETGRELPY